MFKTEFANVLFFAAITLTLPALGQSGKFQKVINETELPYFDLLTTSFSNSTDVLSPIDIEPMGWPNARVCIETAEVNKNANRVYFTSIARFTRVDGPYGSALPEKKIVKILFSSSIGYRDVFAGNEFDSAETVSSSNEITTTDLDANRAPYQTIRIRKNGDDIFYLRTVIQQSAEESTSLNYAGYCYRDITPKQNPAAKKK